MIGRSLIVMLQVLSPRQHSIRQGRWRGHRHGTAVARGFPVVVGKVVVRGLVLVRVRVRVRVLDRHMLLRVRPGEMHLTLCDLGLNQAGRGGMRGMGVRVRIKLLLLWMMRWIMI